MAVAPAVPSALKERLQVAAIDFGTTYSGYAFSFRSDFLQDPLKIITNQWNNKTVSLKTPTCVLFSPDKEFHSFGFEAENKYAELSLEDAHRQWFYFRRFKMRLYGEQIINRTTMLSDDKGLKMPAMTVFSESIKYLTMHLFECCSSRSCGLNPDDVHWVLTVPAIWNDAAKQFMREAAINAGIETTRLTLALEPEAASVFCKCLPVTKMEGADGGSVCSFAPGTKYIVLDAGGGTVDITVHENQRNDTVRELYKANGGPWGGTKVDVAFEDFLAEIVGHGVMEVFQMQHMDDYMELFREFEVKKKTIEPNLSSKVTFKLPITLHDTYRELNNKALRDSLDDTEGDLRDHVCFAGDKLRVDAEQLKHLFKPTCDKIIEHLQGIFSQPSVDGADVLLMVGGFSESKMLQTSIIQAFPRKNVVVPSEASLSVLRGAVIFGHTPKVIVSRVSRCTYGVAMYKPFIQDFHPMSKITWLDGEPFCNDCFDKHVDIDQEIAAGTKCGEHTYYPPTRDSTAVAVTVHTSPKNDPLFVDEPDCTYLGHLAVDLSALGREDNREILVQLIYGDTELGVEAKVVKSGQLLKASFDFLDN